MVYAGSSTQKDLEVRRTSDGGLVWAGVVGSAVTSSPAVAGNAVYLGADDGSVYAFDAAGQTALRRHPTHVSADVVGRDRRRGALLAGGRRRVRVRRLRRPRAPRVQPSADRLLQEPLAEPRRSHAPTVARFGPDGRLYVAQYNGLITCIDDLAHRQQRVHASRTPRRSTSYATSRTTTTTARSRPTVTTRLITGLAVAGTASNPVLYVASSDPRVGGGQQRHGDRPRHQLGRHLAPHPVGVDVDQARHRAGLAALRGEPRDERARARQRDQRAVRRSGRQHEHGRAVAQLQLPPRVRVLGGGLADRPRARSATRPTTCRRSSTRTIPGLVGPVRRRRRQATGEDHAGQSGAGLRARASATRSRSSGRRRASC